MICAIDIGNSALKGALFDDNELGETFRISLEQGPSDVAAALLDRIRASDVSRLGVSSVVPEASRAIGKACAAVHVPVFVLTHNSVLPFELRYETPETMGVDRIAAAAGAWHRFALADDRSVVVVDAGTAITVDVVEGGAFLGGPILPGPELLRRAARSGTAQLPVVDLEWPRRAISRSTREAVATGIMYSLVDGVRGLLDRVAEELEEKPHIVATGGWGKLLSDKIDIIGLYDPDLVVRGVAHLLSINPE